MRYMKVSWDSRPSTNSFLSSPTARSRSASEARSDSGVVGVSAVDPPMNGVSAPSGLRARGRPERSVQADARVEHRVEKVDYQVRDDDEGRGQDRDAQDDGQVLLLDRLDDGPAKPGYAEQGLDDDDPAERGADVEAGQGHHRGERRPQGVPRDHAVFRHALGPGGPDVILP